jgi:hypothetical protein
MIASQFLGPQQRVEQIDQRQHRENESDNSFEHRVSSDPITGARVPDGRAEQDDGQYNEDQIPHESLLNRFGIRI